MVYKRCEGTGTPAKNVTQIKIGNRLPIGGQCQTCKREVEITTNWMIKYHRVQEQKIFRGDSDE